MNDPVDLGSRRELFVDASLIAEMRDVRLQLQRPIKREVVLEHNVANECPTAGYHHAFEDAGRIRLYYRGYVEDVKGPDHKLMQTANLAVSDDGIHFDRPALQAVEFNGSRDNNIVWKGPEAHNFFVFRDANPLAANTDAQYKAVGGGWENLYAFGSPDGIHWHRLQDEPLDVRGTFDSLNVIFWDALTSRYRMFSRYFADFHEDRGQARCRCIQSCESQDFLHWTEPKPHVYNDDPDQEQYYTNATIQCPGAEHTLLAFPKRFELRRKKIASHPHDGVSDAGFMSSRDGVHWHRFREAWLPPDLDWRNWTERVNMPAQGIIRTSPVEWSMYITEHTRHPTNRLRRLSVRPYGFVAVHADHPDGEFVTKPFTFAGDHLNINYATSALGSIQLEIQDAEGKPIDGFTQAQFDHLYGNEIDAPVAWRDGGDLSAIRSRPIRLRCVLKDADLFAIRFGTPAEG